MIKVNQEKIGDFIKKIRKDNNLSQQAFAKKLGVSFQAVSKWENYKNLPDITTLQEIKKQFNVDIDEILEGNKKKQNSNKLLIIVIIILSILLTISIIVFIKNKETFKFDELNSLNQDFSISGSVVRTNERTSIIINNVDYKGTIEDTTYKELECNLYEQQDNTITEISSCTPGNNQTLLEYLKNLKIKMDHYSNNCTMFNTSTLFIEINTKDDNNKITTYKIPIEISNNECN